MYLKIFIFSLFMLRISQCEPSEVPDYAYFEEELDACKKEVDQLNSTIQDLESQIEDLEGQVEELE